MKTTVYRNEFHDAFARMERWNFSYEGLDVLFDYFESLESNTGDEIELDVVGICCEYAENTPRGIAEDYSLNLPDTCGMDEDEADEVIAEAVREHLEDEGVFIGEAGSTFIYRQF